MKTKESILASFREAQDCLKEFLTDTAELGRVEEFAHLLTTTFRRGGKVLSCGNGGSMSDAMHFAEELSGRYRQPREPLAALALSDPGHLTCVANDYGFEEVFARQVRGLGREGDVLLALSTSGNSSNLVRAAEEAHGRKMSVVGLLGRDGGALKDLCHLPILVPGHTSDRIQELHIKIIHIVIEATEALLFPGGS